MPASPSWLLASRNSWSALHRLSELPKAVPAFEVIALQLRFNVINEEEIKIWEICSVPSSLYC